jgi:hypothetical protein
MKTKASRSFKNENRKQFNHSNSTKSKTQTAIQVSDNRPSTAIQRKLSQLANNSNNRQQAAQLYAVSNSTIQKMDVQEEELMQGKFKTIQKLEDEELLQGKFQSIQKQGLEEEELMQGKFITAQKKGIEEEEMLQGKFEPVQKKENNTGLPDNLKSGIENLSGYSLDDVKVHYNSDKPAAVQAHAYAQGTDIHMAPGQEKHLPHEAWHVVQQKQGRVKPTMQMKGNVNVNDDVGLEKEADIMGVKALQMQPKENKKDSKFTLSAPSIANPINSFLSPVQRFVFDGWGWSTQSPSEKQIDNAQKDVVNKVNWNNRETLLVKDLEAKYENADDDKKNTHATMKKEDILPTVKKAIKNGDKLTDAVKRLRTVDFHATVEWYGSDNSNNPKWYSNTSTWEKKTEAFDEDKGNQTVEEAKDKVKTIG